MWPTWGQPGADRTQVGPMWATWTLLSGISKRQQQREPKCERFMQNQMGFALRQLISRICDIQYVFAISMPHPSKNRYIITPLVFKKTLCSVRLILYHVFITDWDWLTETETSLFNTTWHYTDAWYQTYMTFLMYYSVLTWYQILACMLGDLC